MSLASDKIKQSDERFSNIRVEEATYEKSGKKLSVVLLTNRHFTADDEKAIATLISEELPFASVEVTMHKTVCSSDVAARRVYDYIKQTCIPVKDRIAENDIKVTVGMDKAFIELTAEEDVCSYLKTKKFEDLLKNFLTGYFCEDFSVAYHTKANEDNSGVLADEKVDYARIEQIPPRYFKVNAVTRLFTNDETNEVMYIQDAAERTGDLYIAGKVVGVRERTTKTGKPFFIYDFSDGTGRMSGSLFTENKATLKKLEKIQEGSEVIVFGKAEITDAGYHRFSIKSFNFCELPKDFVYQEKQSRRPPETYLLVKPSPIEEIRQTSLFNADMSVPPAFKGTNIVVIDLETTGTSPSDDRVTEIGAVRLVDGKVTEKFATMVNPERKIPEVVVELTGITDEMVADAPVFADVAGDLYKFCYGSIIVAHNIGFDYPFIKNMSKPCGYVYSNRGIDTLALARAVLPSLTNHKLNTVCEHFGIEFLHHRAYSDALATAQMLIELVRLKGGFPEFDV